MEKNSFFGCVLKGLFLSVIISLIGILVFAIILSFSCLPNGVIKAVNQFIKVISIFLGCFFMIKGKGLVKGILIGGLFTAIMYIIFSIIAKIDFSFVNFLIDLIFGIVVGGISGIFSANFRKNKD